MHRNLLKKFRMATKANIGGGLQDPHLPPPPPTEKNCQDCGLE